VPNPAKIGTIAPCATFDRYDNPTPNGCPWMDDPQIPADRQPENAVVDPRGRGGPHRHGHRAVQGHPDMMGDMADMPHTVVLARADVYADALVAAPLARRLSAPILLTGSDGLDARVAQELGRLNAHRVFVMGGTAALSEQVTVRPAPPRA
jgi:putative cell wall-binding protein